MPPSPSALRRALGAASAAARESKAARAGMEGFEYGVAARSTGDGYGGRYGRSLFTNRTPQALKEGLSPIEQAARMAGRAVADSATFASQGLYYAINHPAAIATEVVQRSFQPIGATKQQAALTTLGVASALGVGSNAYRFNPTNLFRPAGYGASAPDPQNPTQTTNPAIEVFDRFRTRRGQILPYEQFLEDTGRTREQFSEAQYKDLQNFQRNRDSQGQSGGVMGGIFRYSSNPYYGPGGAANVFGVDVPVAAAAGAAAIGGAAYAKIRSDNTRRFQELGQKVITLPNGTIDDSPLTASERAEFQRLNRTIGQTPAAAAEAKAAGNLQASDQVLGKYRSGDYPVSQTRTAEGLAQLDPVQLRNEARQRGIPVATTDTPEQLIQRVMQANARSGFVPSSADLNDFAGAFGTPTPQGVPRTNTGPSLRPRGTPPPATGQPYSYSPPPPAPGATPGQPANARPAGTANLNTAYQQTYDRLKTQIPEQYRTPENITRYIASDANFANLDPQARESIAQQFSSRLASEGTPPQPSPDGTPPKTPNSAYEQAYTTARSRNLRTPAEMIDLISKTPGLPTDPNAQQAIAQQFLQRGRAESSANLNTADIGFRSPDQTYQPLSGRASLRDRLSGGRRGAVSRASNIGEMVDGFQVGDRTFKPEESLAAQDYATSVDKPVKVLGKVESKPAPVVYKAPTNTSAPGFDKAEKEAIARQLVTEAPPRLAAHQQALTAHGEQIQQARGQLADRAGVQAADLDWLHAQSAAGSRRYGSFSFADPASAERLVGSGLVTRRGVAGSYDLTAKGQAAIGDYGRLDLTPPPPPPPITYQTARGSYAVAPEAAEATAQKLVGKAKVAQLKAAPVATTPNVVQLSPTVQSAGSASTLEQPRIAKPDQLSDVFWQQMTPAQQQQTAALEAQRSSRGRRGQAAEERITTAKQQLADLQQPTEPPPQVARLRRPPLTSDSVTADPTGAPAGGVSRRASERAAAAPMGEAVLSVPVEVMPPDTAAPQATRREAISASFKAIRESSNAAQLVPEGGFQIPEAPKALLDAVRQGDPGARAALVRWHQSPESDLRRVATPDAPDTPAQPSVQQMQAAQRETIARLRGGQTPPPPSTPHPLSAQLDEAMRGYMAQPKPRSTWLRIPGGPDGEDLASVYVRKTQRFLEGKTIPTVEVANIDFHPSVRGQGIGTQFLQSLQQNYPDRAVYVEAIGNDRLARNLMTKQGFTQDPLDQGAPSVYKLPQQSQQSAPKPASEGFSFVEPTRAIAPVSTTAPNLPPPTAPKRLGTVDIGGGERAIAPGNPFEGASRTAARLSVEREGAPRRPATMTVGSTLPESQRPLQLIPGTAGNPGSSSSYNPSEFSRLENRFQNSPPPGSVEAIRNADNLQAYQGTKDLLNQVRDDKAASRAVARMPSDPTPLPSSVGQPPPVTSPATSRSQALRFRAPAYTATRLDPRESVLAEAYALNPNANYQTAQTVGQRSGVFAYEPPSVTRSQRPTTRQPAYSAIPENQSLIPYNPTRAVVPATPRSVQPFESPFTAVQSAGTSSRAGTSRALSVGTSQALTPYTPPTRALPAVPQGATAGIESNTRVIGNRPKINAAEFDAAFNAAPIARASVASRLGGVLKQVARPLSVGAVFLDPALEYRQAVEEGETGARTAARVIASPVTATVAPLADEFVRNQIVRAASGGNIPFVPESIKQRSSAAVGQVYDRFFKAPVEQFTPTNVTNTLSRIPGLGQVFQKSEPAQVADRSQQVLQQAGGVERQVRDPQTGQVTTVVSRAPQAQAPLSAAWQQRLSGEAQQNQAAAQARSSTAAASAQGATATANRLAQQQADRQQAIEQRIATNASSGKLISGKGGLTGALGAYFGQSGNQSATQAGGRGQGLGNRGQGLVRSGQAAPGRAPSLSRPSAASSAPDRLQRAQQQGAGGNQSVAQEGSTGGSQPAPRVASRSVVAPQLVPGTPEYEKLNDKQKQAALTAASSRANTNARNQTQLDVAGIRSGDTRYRTDAQYGEGGSTDRTNQSRETIADQNNQTRYRVADLTSDRQLQGKELQYGEGGSTDRTNASKSGDVRYQSDARSGDVRYQTDGRSRDVNSTNKSRENIADLTSGRRLKGTVYTADQRLKGTQYTADQRLTGTVYTADRRLQGVDLTSNRKLQGTVYTADRGYDAKTDTARITGGYKVAQEGVKQGGAVQVAGIKGQAALGVAAIAGGAKVSAASIGVEGVRYKADATVRVADLTSQRKLEAENTKALSAINTGVIKSGSALIQSEERTRVARLKQLGVY